MPVDTVEFLIQSANCRSPDSLYHSGVRKLRTPGADSARSEWQFQWQAERFRQSRKCSKYLRGGSEAIELRGQAK